MSTNGSSQHGVVKWFNEAKGYGFIKREGLPDVFVHVTDLAASDPPLELLSDGEAVTYDIAPGKKGGEKAVNIKVA